ncbi:mannitol/fructose-specific phosphotransferase system IIA component (Ntr-type) [Pelolinea submarina]|uniref:Mannitol/fructose-specific phosphotransferase system IIA component (Ntr-type) n=3 Tax=Pelolinea submarina TaxID=913107 RepID=A0A3E0AB52_9CHLR|nr:mannitol/fructose-specific phosphotransferase system IIA component (Ntr-type) [Pelolinea submarina]
MKKTLKCILDSSTIEKMFQKLITCLSSNSKKVLMALISRDDPVSAQHLADSLGLSISQVRYSIKKIQACLIFNGTDIQLKPNEGIQIILDKETKSELLDLIQNNSQDITILNQEERVRLLLQIILASRKDLPQSEIRAITGISYTSFYRDFEKVRSWLNSFSLTLTAKRNAPVCVLGDELKIREAIQAILLQNLGQDYVIQACVLAVEDIDFNDIERSVFYFQAQDIIRDLNLPHCEQTVRNLEVQYHSPLFDQAHVELTVYLGIMAYRIKLGKYISKTAVDNIKECNTEVDIVANILKDFGIDADDPALAAEKEYLNYLIAQCFLYGTNEQQHPHPQNDESRKFDDLAKTIVKEIAKYLHAGLYEDEELIQCIIWELTYASKGKQTRGDIYDSSEKELKPANNTEQILRKILFPILNEARIQHINQIISAISNHTLAALEKVRSSSCQRRVLLVCGAGVATAFSLRSQLNTLIPEIDVVEMVSVFDLVHNDGLVDGCDAIISTLPLGNITEVPQIHVNAMLSKEDVSNIRKSLGIGTHFQDFSTSFQVNRPINLQEVVNIHTIKTHQTAENPADVIDQVGRLLLDIDAIWPSYIKAMQNLYKLYGPYMVIAPNTALLHAGPEMGSKKLAISLITLDTPVQFGHALYDPVNIAMAFSSPVNSVHTNILSDVFNFFAIPQNRINVLHAKDPADVMTLLSNIEVVEAVGNTAG